jgi:hypothetical protein
MKSKATRRHPLQWILEPMEAEPSFFQKHMFGCQAAYLYGRLVLVLADKEEPWNGLLVCTSREYHSALVTEYPGLQPHPVLPKWLYLTQSSTEFEETAQQLVLKTLKNDRRIGVEPGGGKRKKPVSRSVKKRGIARTTFD